MSGLSENDNVFFKRLTDMILINIGNENFGIMEISRELGMSHRNINRRLHEITNKSINQLIRETRLQKAAEILQIGNLTASEVAYKVGFNSPAYFNKCFHEYFGYPPGKILKGEHVNVNNIKQFQVTERNQNQSSLSRKLLFFALGALILTILVFVFYTLILRPRATTQKKDQQIHEKSIAVLPFRNLSEMKSNHYIVEGLMDEIFTSLSEIHDLRVVSRASVDQFRNSPRTAVEIAKILNVDYIVEGSGQECGNRIRFRVLLIDAIKDKQLWAQPYENEIRSTSDIYVTQRQIAQSIVREIEATISPEAKSFLNK